MSLYDAKTLTELIREGKNNKYRKKDYSTFVKLGDNLLTVGGSFLDKYWDFIESNKIRVRLDSDQFIKYKYRPKELSYDLYGTEELYVLLLKLNNISHEIQFTKKRIYIADKSTISSIINKIININQDTITKNQKSY